MIFYDPTAPAARERRPNHANFRPGGKEPGRQPFGRCCYHDHSIIGGQVTMHRCQPVAAPAKRAVALRDALCADLDAVRDGVLILADGGYPKQDGGTDVAR